MDMVFQFIVFYCLASVVIGMTTAAVVMWQGRKHIFSEAYVQSVEHAFMDEQAEEGHIQKEIYDERVVYHYKDDDGVIALKTSDHLKRIRQERPYLWVFLYFLVGTSLIALTWPKMAFEFALNRKG